MLAKWKNKGGQKNTGSLGIIKSSYVSHCVEASKEIYERQKYGDKADQDPFYDMHYENAKSLLNKLK